MQGVKQLRAGDYPHYTGLQRPYRPWHLVRNMLDGPTSPADMYLFFYAAIDLLAESLHPTTTLDDVSINGFLRSRPVHHRAHGRALQQPDHQRLGHPELPRGGR